MMRRLALTTVLLTAAGCATQQGAEQGKGSTPAASKEERMRIGNQAPFDVAVCQSKPITLPQPPNQASLVGAILSLRPQVMECLVDPKHRGSADSTRVTVKTSLTDKAATHTVSGDNLTPEGVACIQKVVDTQVPLSPLPAGAAALESSNEFVHEAANSPSVKFGLNPGSDYSGNVRLAQTGWCECYAGFATKAPPIIKANVDLKRKKEKKDKDSPETVTNTSDVTLDDVGTPEGNQLAACLKGKMAAVPSSIPVDELKFPYRFVHFNSRAGEAPADMPPELRFFQLELVRGQRSAETALALGARTNAAEAYDAVVQKYQKTKDYGLVSDMKAKCATLGTASQAIVDAVDGQLKADQSSKDLATELKAKDAAWADVETKLTEVVNGTQQDLDNAKKRLENDKAICPKESTAPAPKKGK